MKDVIALLGLFLFWASLIWLPLSLARAVLNRAGPQVWAISSILTFGLVFMGFTRTMMQGTTTEAFAWLISWAMPVGLALFARSAPEAVFRQYDKWAGATVVVTFLLAVPFLPAILREAAQAIW